MPQTYDDVFRRLGERGVVSVELATRLAAASGLRNLIAHQYGVLDSSRVYAIASERLEDYLIRVDHDVTCKTRGKGFEIPSHRALVFVEELEGLPQGVEEEAQQLPRARGLERLPVA